MAATAVLKMHTAPEPAGASARELLHVARPEEPNAGAAAHPSRDSTRSAPSPPGADITHVARCGAVQAHFA